MKEKISIIIPCYNVGEYIDRCLESVLGQTYGSENLEIILVDDASTDDTVFHIMKYEEKYPKQIMLIKCDRNGRMGAARNIGMDAATGKYISFVDADDLCAPDMLSKLADAMEQYDCDMTECKFLEFKSEDEIKDQNDAGENTFISLGSIDARRRFINDSKKVAVWGRLYRRSFLVDNGLRFLEGLIYEDVHFSGISMFLINRYCRVNETLYFYYRNTQGVIHSKCDPKILRQEGQVMDLFLSELSDRGMLENILKDYYQEFEFYCIYKALLDPLKTLMISDLPDEEKYREMFFHVDYIKGVFPKASENRYLDIDDDYYQFAIGLLKRGN